MSSVWVGLKAITLSDLHCMCSTGVLKGYGKSFKLNYFENVLDYLQHLQQAKVE